MNPETKTRVKTALIAASVVFPVLVWGGIIGLFILSGVILLIGCAEISRMVVPSVIKQIQAMIWCLLFTIIWLYMFLPLQAKDVEPIFMYLLISLVVSLLAFLEHAGQGKAYFLSTNQSIVAILWLWLVLGLTGVCTIRIAPQGFEWLWFLLVTVWLTDIGGYFFGRAWGKKKMAPTISPGKTWVGTFGGVASATLGGTLFGVSVDLHVLPLLLICFSFTVSVFAIVGDLYESLIKRTFGVKDSGTLLPGHGGVLDRLDSILFASPVLACLLALIN